MLQRKTTGSCSSKCDKSNVYFWKQSLKPWDGWWQPDWYVPCRNKYIFQSRHSKECSQNMSHHNDVWPQNVIHIASSSWRTLLPTRIKILWSIYETFPLRNSLVEAREYFNSCIFVNEELGRNISFWNIWNNEFNSNQHNPMKPKWSPPNTDWDVFRINIDCSFSQCVCVHVFILFESPDLWINGQCGWRQSDVVFSKCWQMVRNSAPIMDCWCLLIHKACFFPATTIRDPLKTRWALF